MDDGQRRFEAGAARLKSFLLAHDVRYAGHADWGPAHRRWVSQYAFSSEWQQFAFEELRRTIEDRLAQCQRVETALLEAVTNWRFYPAVLGLQAMRGVQFTTAVGMLAELGDLSRFDNIRVIQVLLGHFCSSRCVAKLCLKVCMDTRLSMCAASAAAWMARFSGRVLSGSMGSSPGKSHPPSSISAPTRTC